MQRIKKIVGLYILIVLAACQAFPALKPNSAPTGTPGGPALTPAPSPAPTSLPTSVPVEQVDSGDKALFFGDYDLARKQYLSAFDDSDDKGLQAAALWGLARVALSEGRYQTALESLNRLTAEYSDSTYAARAYFLIGQAYEK